jgi:hypothetical protein
MSSTRKSKIAESLGITIAERDELILFCLADNYPRKHKIKRLGTSYTLTTAQGAALMLRRLRFGRKSLIAHVTLTAQCLEFDAAPDKSPWLKFA